MFKKLTDSQKDWLIITACIAEAVAMIGGTVYCINSMKTNNDKMKKLMEMDEFKQLIDMIKE